MKYKDQDGPAARNIFIGLALFLAGVALGGCAVTRAERQELAELRAAIPECSAIADGYARDEKVINYLKLRVELCDDLNTALKTYHDFMTAPKKEKAPAKKVYKGGRDVEKS